MAEINKERKNLLVFENVKKYSRNIFLWPKEGKKFSLKFFWKITLLGAIMAIPMGVGQMGHIYISCKRLQRSDLINDIGHFLLASTYISCGLFFAICCKKVDYIIWNINHTIRSDCKNFTMLTKRIEYLTTFIYRYVFFVGATYVGFSLYSNKKCEARKMIGGEEMFGYICGVSSPAWFPINLDFFPWKHYLIGCNVIFMAHILPSGATLMILYYGFLVFAVERIDYLVSVLEEINPVLAEKEAKKKLKFCAKYHADITEYVNNINDTVGLIFAGMQNGLLSLILALLEYQILLEKSVLAFMGLTIWMLIQAVACNCGQTLEDASSRLRERVYGMPWHQMSASFQKDFKIFHGQIQQGLYLRMKPLIVMNMVFYYQFMNGSYSILMFLMNLEKKNARD